MPTDIPKTTKKVSPRWTLEILAITAIVTVLILFIATGH